MSADEQTIWLLRTTWTGRHGETNGPCFPFPARDREHATDLAQAWRSRQPKRDGGDIMNVTIERYDMHFLELGLEPVSYDLANIAERKK
jgi:hypothetical protein